MKNIKTKILVSLSALLAFAPGANAATVPGVALVVAPASLSETVGSTFYSSVVVKTPGDKVYAVEGTLALDGLYCQSVMVAEGLMAQSVPTCAKPYFLIGIPSGTATDKAILRVEVKALRAGDATLELSSVDVIGEGMSLSNVATGAVYTIAENITPVDNFDGEVNAPIIIHPKVQTKIDKVAIENEPASSTPSTQLAAVADFVTTNSMMLWTLALLAVVLGYRYISRRYEVVVPAHEGKHSSKEGKK